MTGKRKDIFTYIFVLWYATEIIFNTTIIEIAGIPIEQINSLINYLILGLLMLQIVLFQKYELRELSVIAIITVPIVVSAILSSYFVILSAWMFIVAAKNTEFEKLIRIAYKVLKIMVPLIIILCFIGIIDDYTTVRNGMLRYSLGFSHPNQLGLRLFQLLACHFYINRENIKVRSYLGAIIIICVAYYIPNSKTSCMCMMALLILFVLYRIVRRYNASLLHLYVNCLIIMTILFNMLSIVWSIKGVTGNSIIKQLDMWMSIRFSTCHRVFQLYGISFWGQRIYVTADERTLVGIHNVLFLDNAYMALLLRYGIVVYLFFTIAYISGMLFFKKKNYDVLMIVFSVYALYGVMENGLFVTSHNIFLVALSSILYRKNILAGQDVKKKKYLFRIQKLKGI